MKRLVLFKALHMMEPRMVGKTSGTLYLEAYKHWIIFTEIAENFKEQGNDYYKGKRYREALGFYTQGVDAKPENSKLLEALLCNMAACNLELREFYILNLI